MNNYDYQLKYQSGTNSLIADCLSRVPNESKNYISEQSSKTLSRINIIS